MISPAPGAATTNRSSRTDLDRVLVAAFLENVPDYVYFKDRDSRFIAASHSIVKYFGCATAAELHGKTDFDFFSEEHARPAFEDEQQIIRSGEPLLGKLEKETWPDGRVTWVLTSKLPLRDESGAIIGTFGLSKDVTDSKRMEAELDKAHKELLETSRLAGMAEVATGVLHNVGNVLNSLNVSASLIANGLRQSKIESIAKVSSLLAEHRDDLAHFLTEDPKGRRVPEFIDSLAKHTEEERLRLMREVDSLQKNIDHIKEIVSMQQAYATMISVIEPLDPATLMEDALRMNSTALVRHEVRVVRDYQAVPPVSAEKAKVLQILVNLIRNAKYATDEAACPDKVMTLQLVAEGDHVNFVVKDNGIGILPENLTRIFSHGFTTRVKGHGFGLHSSALAAKEMKGKLTGLSEGHGKGATFILTLPIAPPDSAGS